MPQTPVVQSRSWVSLLRTARASFGVLLIASLALLLPSQTGDELAALYDIDVGIFPGIVVLQFALAFLAVSAWYWARSALSARFGLSDTESARSSLVMLDQKAFALLPRLLFLMGVLLSFALLIRSFSFVHGLSVALWAAPGYALIHWRLPLLARMKTQRVPERPVPTEALASRNGLLPWLRTVLPRFRTLLRCAPFGPITASASLLAGAACFAWGTVESFVRWGPQYPGFAALAAEAFPGPSVAIIGIALMIGPLTALIFIVDGLRVEIDIRGLPIGFRRPPLFLALLAWVLAAPFLVSLHAVRVLPQSTRVPTLDDRKTLADFFKSWVKTCATASGPVRPVIVAVSGGASRAGIWAARVLAEVDAVTGNGNNTAIFAVSSVSGGSLGAAAYMAVAAAQTATGRCRSDGGDPRPSALTLDKLTHEHLGGDALGPLLAGTLLGDIPRALALPITLPIRRITGVTPRGGDRAEAIERAFDHLWRENIARAGLTDLAIPSFNDGFLSLFYEDSQKIRPGMPVWISNGTDMATGRRILTVPFNSSPAASWPFYPALDALGILGADVAISTAINNSARFPYLEPSGELTPVSEASKNPGTHAEILDGGYFDNEGLLTSLELASWLRNQKLESGQVQPIIVQATADADYSFGPAAPIVRCPDMPIDNPTGISQAPRALQLLAPFLGLNSVRGAHSAVVLRQVRNGYCLPTDQYSFFHFYLFRPPGREIPLNWLLSKLNVDAIRAGLDANSPNGNDKELKSMKDVLDVSRSR